MMTLATTAPAARDAFAWGAKGHSTVNATAADLMTSPAANFFRANKAALERLANVPDVKWKRSGTLDAERPMHFFQWDRYGAADLAGRFDEYLLPQIIRRLGRDYVKENGTAIWRITSLQAKLTAALRDRNWERAVQLAGVLGHYVGDLAQPMHLTSDYDGQSIGRRGVHRYFETTLVDEVSQQTLDRAVLESGASHRNELDSAGPDPRGPAQQAHSVALEQGKAAYVELPDVLGHFDTNSQNDRALTDMAKQRMGQGAATLAVIWDLAVEQSGINSGFPRAGLGQIEDPEWIPLEDMPVVSNDRPSGGRPNRPGRG